MVQPYIQLYDSVNRHDFFARSQGTLAMVTL